MKFNTKKIIQLDGANARIIAVISVLDAYLNSINKKAFNSINSSCKEDVTLSELGIVYSNWIMKNNGMHGVCWEYYIYHSIKHDDDYLQELINESINVLTKDNSYDNIDVLLWGGEKIYITSENVKKCIGEDDMIWTNQGRLNFSKYIDIIQDAFRDKNKRALLPIYANETWKTDLFVKKRSDNLWFAVNVKWNQSDIKYHNGISIGIVFNDMNTQGERNNPLVHLKFDDAYFIVINMYHWISQYFIDSMNYLNTVLLNINVESSKTDALKFPTVCEKEFFRFLKKNRYAKCDQIFDYLKDKLNVKNKIVDTNEIIAQTGKSIYISENEIKGSGSFKILPKYEI